MKKERYICGCAKKHTSKYIKILYTLNGQLTPPSLGGPIKNNYTI